MSWEEDLKDDLKDLEDSVESVVPRSYAAKFKLVLDRLLPFALVLLVSLLVVNFLVPVGKSFSIFVTYGNWLLICFFSLRLAMAFRLAESDKRFLKEHWFDALLVIPAFTLIQELEIFELSAASVFEESGFAGGFLAGFPVAAKMAKFFNLLRRTLKF